uniref:Glycosyltransferase n=1 Tax=Centella asiatica TaxID=48106 RepID=A0A2I7M6E4_CENAS|nr:UDP-glucosyltransferase 84K1 [Centella asiatica]
MAMDGERKGINVLMVAFAAQGHMNPMLLLGQRLLSKGLNVTFATNEVARDRLINSAAVIGIHLDFYSDGLSLDYDRGSNLNHFMETIGKFGPINLSSLVERYSKNVATKFSCIISNPFVPWVADVAAAHGIPCAMLWIQPCTLYAIYYRFYNNLNYFPTTENFDSSVELPGFPLLVTEDLPSFILPSNDIVIFPKLLSQLFQNMKKHKWVLGNTFYELEKNVVDSMENVHPIRPVGPLVPPTLLGENEKLLSDDVCIKWLDSQEKSSVIYISFGTIIELSTKEMEIVAKTLKKTQFKFLWVLKKGEEMLPLGFLEESKNQGLIVKWSPQVQVLAHPAVACFLTHCGWNSLNETITAGVPVIAFPQWTDQPTNAKLIDIFADRSAAPAGPRTEDLVVRSWKKCMQEVMEGATAEEYKKNAAELKLAARAAVADGGSSDRNIRWFIDEVMGLDKSK